MTNIKSGHDPTCSGEGISEDMETVFTVTKIPPLLEVFHCSRELTLIMMCLFCSVTNILSRNMKEDSREMVEGFSSSSSSFWKPPNS